MSKLLLCCVHWLLVYSVSGVSVLSPSFEQVCDFSKHSLAAGDEEEQKDSLKKGEKAPLVLLTASPRFNADGTAVTNGGQAGIAHRR